MKRLLLRFFLTMTISTQIFSFSIRDYQLYNDAKLSFQSNDYKKTKESLEALERNFPSSLLVRSNYFNYLKALNFEKLGDIESAINHMEKAVYTPKSTSGKNFFRYRRNYYLSKFHLENKDYISADFYLQNLISKDVKASNPVYEKFALENLKVRDPLINDLYAIRYNRDFSSLKNFSEKNLLNLGEYLVSQNLFSYSEEVYKFLLEKYKDDLLVHKAYLETLFKQKKFLDMLEFSATSITKFDDPEITYYRGEALKNRGYNALAIGSFSMLVNRATPYYKDQFILDARNSLFELYFLEKEYDNIINLYQKSHDLNKNETFIYIKSLFENREFSKALEEAVAYLKKFPFSYEANSLYELLVNLDFKVTSESYDIYKNSLNKGVIEKSAKGVNRAINNTKEFTFDFSTISNEKELEKIFNISKLQDQELLELELDNTLLLTQNDLMKGVLLTELYETGSFYPLAFFNSKLHERDFMKYSNLMLNLYPRYYEKEVTKYSNIYDVPDYLIYTIIALSSDFNKDLLSSEERLGLMQVPIKGEGVDYSYLTEPDLNIDNGVFNLKKLLDKYSNDNIKALISYLYGEDTLKQIPFINNDFYYEDIKDTATREKVIKGINTLFFYKALYN